MKPLALVIENDAGTRKLLNVLLTRVGMDVDLVPTGDDAFIVLQHVPYDVLGPPIHRRRARVATP